MSSVEKLRVEASKIRRKVAASMSRLPEPVRAEIQDASRRLLKVRSVDDASAMVTYEVERLLTVVAPTFVRYPLRVGPTSGRLVVGLTAGGAAFLEEFEAVATVMSLGAASPGAPVVLAADFAALVVEAYVAASVRIGMLQRGGYPVVAEEVAKDLARAMTGSSAGPTRDVTQDLASGIAKRVIRRWAAGVTPLVGIAYDGWDAQKTVVAISRMPPPAPLSMALSVPDEPPSFPERMGWRRLR